MHFFALLAVAGAARAIKPFVIHPPRLVSCETVLLTWSGGEGPYQITVCPQTSDSTPSTYVERITTTGNLSVEWTVDVPAGTILSFFGICGGETSVGYNRETRIDGVEVFLNPHGNTSCLDKTAPHATVPPRAVPRSKTGTIVGAVVGTVGGLLLIAGALLWYTGCCGRRHRRMRIRKEAISKPHDLDHREMGMVAGAGPAASQQSLNDDAQSASSGPASTLLASVSSTKSTTPPFTPPAFPSPTHTTPSRITNESSAVPTDSPPGYATPERQSTDGRPSNMALATPSLASSSQPSPNQNQNQNRNRLSGQTFTESPRCSRIFGRRRSNSVVLGADERDQGHDNDDNEPRSRSIPHDVAVPTLGKLAPPSPTAQIFSSLQRQSLDQSADSHVSGSETQSKSPHSPNKWRRLSVRSAKSVGE